MLKQPQNARFAGYEEVKADVLSISGSAGPSGF